MWLVAQGFPAWLVCLCGACRRCGPTFSCAVDVRLRRARWGCSGGLDQHFPVQVFACVLVVPVCYQGAGCRGPLYGLPACCGPRGWRAGSCLGVVDVVCRPGRLHVVGPTFSCASRVRIRYTYRFVSGDLAIVGCS